MSIPPKTSPAAEDPLYELLDAGRISRPRPEFRADLRERLTSPTAAAPPGSAGPSVPVWLGGLIAGILAVAFIVVWWSGRSVPAETPAVPPPAAQTDAAPFRSAPDELPQRLSPPTLATTGAPTVAPSVVPTDAPVAVASSLPATATGVPTERATAVERPQPMPPEPSATREPDAPEQTPVPIATATPDASPTPWATEPSGGLPATPTPAPTGPGWPTLPPPGTPTPGSALDTR